MEFETLIKRLKKEEKLKLKSALVVLPKGQPVRDLKRRSLIPKAKRGHPLRKTGSVTKWPSLKYPTVPQYLAYILCLGIRMHKQTIDSFVEYIVRGYYYYERRTEWRTCAVAAMTAAVYGSQFVERETFNFNEAQYMLSRWVDTDLSQVGVTMDNGARLPILEAVISLNDAGWQRESIATWLHNLV